MVDQMQMLHACQPGGCIELPLPATGLQLLPRGAKLGLGGVKRLLQVGRDGAQVLLRLLALRQLRP